MNSSRASKKRKLSHDERAAPESDQILDDETSKATTEHTSPIDDGLNSSVERDSNRKRETPNPRLSGRQRRPPRRFSTEVGDSQHNSPRSKPVPSGRGSKVATPRPLRPGEYADASEKSDTKDAEILDPLSIDQSLSTSAMTNGKHLLDHNKKREAVSKNETKTPKKNVAKKTPLSKGPPIPTDSTLETTLRIKTTPRPPTVPLPQTDEQMLLMNPIMSAQSRSSRRKNDRTENLDSALENDFEDAITGEKSSVTSSRFRHAESQPFTDPKSSARKVSSPPFVVSSAHRFNPQSSSQSNPLKRVVLEKLTDKRPVPLVGLEEEYEKVHTMVEQTVLAGEGNSMLLIGARGSGKSALINAVLRDLSKNNREQYHVIRLSGFIQTDDKLALREIWRQLGQEMEIDEEGPARNYADTLSTLLALLSYSPESLDGENNQVARSVVFVIDEFDLFTAHPRQTLLYNLFDIAQSRKAPIAVFGLTTRVNVVESLEKRVKSRFSHRYVHMSLPKSLLIFQQICKSALQILPEELAINEQLKMASGPPKNVPKMSETHRDDSPSLTTWNRSVESFLASSEVSRYMSRVYHTNKSIPTALTGFYMPVTLCSTNSPTLISDTLRFDTLSQPPDSKLTILPALSSLALALLISAARLDVILDTDTCNFNMVYDEYSNLAAKARLAASTTVTGIGIGGKVWGQEVARAAWERLIEVELLIPAIGTGTGTGAGDMVRCDVALEEIEGAMPDLDKTLEKWVREI